MAYVYMESLEKFSVKEHFKQESIKNGKCQQNEFVVD